MTWQWRGRRGVRTESNQRLAPSMRNRSAVRGPATSPGRRRARAGDEPGPVTTRSAGDEGGPAMRAGRRQPQAKDETGPATRAGQRRLQAAATSVRATSAERGLATSAAARAGEGRTGESVTGAGRRRARAGYERVRAKGGLVTGSGRRRARAGYEHGRASRVSYLATAGSPPLASSPPEKKPHCKLRGCGEDVCELAVERPQRR